MFARMLAVVTCVLSTLPVAAGEMSPDQAQRFVAGKLFSFSCFDGTSGMGRIHGDGSVAGNVNLQGQGPIKFMRLPSGTLRVRGEAVCASVRGMPFEPCFRLVQLDDRSFRGSVSGLGFAYCDFTRRDRGRAVFTRSASAAPQNIKPKAETAED